MFNIKRIPINFLWKKKYFCLKVSVLSFNLCSDLHWVGECCVCGVFLCRHKCVHIYACAHGGQVLLLDIFIDHYTFFTEQRFFLNLELLLMRLVQPVSLSWDPLSLFPGCGGAGEVLCMSSLDAGTPALTLVNEVLLSTEPSLQLPGLHSYLPAY